MKKILLAGLTVFLTLSSHAVFARCSKTLALRNLSSETVVFSTIPDPGFQPEVKPGTEYKLPTEFITSCNNITLCTVQIYSNSNPSAFTTISKVPNGSRITYLHPGNDGYSVDANAGICA